MCVKHRKLLFIREGINIKSSEFRGAQNRSPTLTAAFNRNTRISFLCHVGPFKPFSEREIKHKFPRISFWTLCLASEYIFSPNLTFSFSTFHLINTPLVLLSMTPTPLPSTQNLLTWLWPPLDPDEPPR